MNLPMSLRTTDSELAYQNAKKDGLLNPLLAEPALKEFTHWRLIENRYPYNIIFSKHHMLVPKREAANYDNLKTLERIELREIIDTYCQDHYDLVFENMSKQRSVKAVYHLHLASYVPTREALEKQEPEIVINKYEGHKTAAKMYNESQSDNMWPDTSPNAKPRVTKLWAYIFSINGRFGLSLSRISTTKRPTLFTKLKVATFTVLSRNERVKPVASISGEKYEQRTRL